jgi:hypothetical protein
MDGDGQHKAEYLKDIINKVQSGECDMCIGSRFINKQGFQSGILRRAGIKFLSALTRVLCGAKVKDVTSGFRACNKKLIKFYAHNYAQDYPEPEAIISAVCAGYSVCEVPVVMQERKSGVSSINAFKGVYYMFKVGLALVVWRLLIKKPT